MLCEYNGSHLGVHVTFDSHLSDNQKETRMKASESLQNDQSTATEKALRFAFDTTPAFIHTARPDGYFDYFNRPWLDFLGKSLEDVCGWHWTESVHPEDVAGTVQKWRAALASGEPFEAEARVRCADGTYRAFLHRKVPLHDEHGKIVKWFGSSIDIEDRKRAEERRPLEAELQATLNVIPAYTWHVLPSGALTFVNEGTADPFAKVLDSASDSLALLRWSFDLVIELSDLKLETLRQDGDFILYRGRHRRQTDATPPPILVLTPAMEHPAPGCLRRMEHEFSLKAELDPAWAVRPLALTQEQDRSFLLLDDPGAEPLDLLLEEPMELGQLLRFAIGLSAALVQLHARGLIHKEIKPANVLANPSTGQVWLMGFGIASRLPRERQSPEPPEFIAGTLPYMAPEQTGRMNRSIDSRSDLYALGVTLYEMLTGSLPFTATDPMEWVHCHIARRPVSPAERLKDVPRSVSEIIMKLLAKTAEDRYQTAAGLERDLRRCLAQWEAERRIDAFPLGQEDRPDRLLIPEKLYGREREIEKLLASFDRVIKGGTRELVLVAGYSGIGKSSVVNELHKVLVPPRGLFASGKFDQVQARHPLFDARSGFPEPHPAPSGEERGRPGTLARRASRGARPERSAHDRPRPATEADHRRPAAGS